eukprot:NODE_124_length_2431_cov_1589.605793_g90_i0.p1 GENE.NODE_124_length_2431_cov_1589.605793_g90_i0~~NODE_124_length_2431_cov_1589.605793_g90_i0.p1  ORF type:complete len:567 (+),score=72.26 NODE_124_length_2431_cov_1589.605793_g90_i0:492-2192(+)
MISFDGYDEPEAVAAKELMQGVNAMVSNKEGQLATIDTAVFSQELDSVSGRIRDQVFSTLLVAREAMRIQRYNTQSPKWKDFIIPQCRRLMAAAFDTKFLVEDAFMAINALVDSAHAFHSMVRRYNGEVPPQDVCELIADKMLEKLKVVQQLHDAASKNKTRIRDDFKAIAYAMCAEKGREMANSPLADAHQRLAEASQAWDSFQRSLESSNAAILAGENKMSALEMQVALMDANIGYLEAKAKADLDNKKETDAATIGNNKKADAELAAQKAKFDACAADAMKKLTEKRSQDIANTLARAKETKETGILFWIREVRAHKTSVVCEEQARDRLVTASVEQSAQGLTSTVSQYQSTLMQNAEQEMAFQKRIVEKNNQDSMATTESLASAIKARDAVITAMEQLNIKLQEANTFVEHSGDKSKRLFGELKTAEEMVQKVRDSKDGLQADYGLCGKSLEIIMDILNHLPEACLTSGGGSPIDAALNTITIALEGQVLLMQKPRHFATAWGAFLEVGGTMKKDFANTRELTEALFCGKIPPEYMLPGCATGSLEDNKLLLDADQHSALTE